MIEGEFVFEYVFCELEVGIEMVEFDWFRFICDLVEFGLEVFVFKELFK